MKTPVRLSPRRQPSRRPSLLRLSLLRLALLRVSRPRPSLPRRALLGRSLLAGALLVCALLTAAAAAAPVRVTDDRGATVTLARPPQRIVSLLPSLTETVCALDACDRLVGTDRFSNWPPAVRALPKLGGLEDVQIEALVRLTPDVVLASRTHRLLDRLEALGVPVLAFSSETHADARRTFERVAALLGEPAAAASAWARIETQLDAAAARVPARLRGARVYVEIGGGPWAAGRASFIGETLARLGVDNVVPPELGPFPKLNPEHVLRLAPQVIVIHAHDARTLPDRPGWATLPALRDGRVCAYESEPWEILVRPGPRIGEAARLLADCFARFAAPTPPSR